MNPYTGQLHGRGEVLAAFTEGGAPPSEESSMAEGVDVESSPAALKQGSVPESASASTESRWSEDEKQLRSTWVPPTTTTACHQEWMAKLDAGDLSGVPVPVECYIPLRGSTITENVRATEDYKDKCCEAVGLGAEVDITRYAHFATAGAAALAVTAAAAAAAGAAASKPPSAAEGKGSGSAARRKTSWASRRTLSCSVGWSVAGATVCACRRRRERRSKGTVTGSLPEVRRSGSACTGSPGRILS